MLQLQSRAECPNTGLDKFSFFFKILRIRDSEQKEKKKRKKIETMTRRWSKSNNIPYKNKVIIDAMPTTFRGSYDKLPNRFKKLYKQENI